MEVRQIEFGTPEFDEALALRNAILRIPLGLEFEAKDIQNEWDSMHLGIYTKSQALSGCLTLLPVNKSEIKMRQVAVSESQQRKGIGSRLVAACEELCKDHNYEKITLHARKEAVAFYRKLGYKTQGKQFKEVGIPHYKMYKIVK